MTKLSDEYKNKVLNHTTELVNRHKILMKAIKRDNKKGRPMQPTDRQISKFWPLEMLCAQYGARILNEELLGMLSSILSIKKTKVARYAFSYLKELNNKRQEDIEAAVESIPNR